MAKLSQSNVKPETVWVRSLGDGNAIVTLRRNVTKDFGEDDEVIYEYEEASVTLIERVGLAEYAEENINGLFDLAEQKETDGTLPTQVDALTAIVTDLMIDLENLRAELEDK